MKEQSTIMLAIYWTVGIAGLVLMWWFIQLGPNNEMDNDYNQVFFKKYNEQPDTCILLGNKVLFLKEFEVEYEKTVHLYIFEKNKMNENPCRKIVLHRAVFYDPIDTLHLVEIDNKEYLYIEHVLGGGSMGNHLIDFSLYCLNNDESYILGYEFYPEDVSTVSTITSDESLKDKPQLLAFLYEKMQASERYDDFLVFIDKFCSDKEFQLSRIKFPVSYIRQSVLEESKDTYSDADGYYKFVPADKSQWKMLTKKDMTPMYSEKHHFEAKWERKSPQEINFMSGWIDSDADTSISFKKINGKWFLIDYYQAI